MRRLLAQWPGVRIVFRGDSGLCRQRILNWCERAGVHYIVGLARNARLQAQVVFEVAPKKWSESTSVSSTAFEV